MLSGLAQVSGPPSGPVSGPPSGQPAAPGPGRCQRARRRPRLRTILLLVNLVVLILPLGGIALLRLYESALIRQTESELIAQGAFLQAFYRAALQRRHAGAVEAADWAADYGNPMHPEALRRVPAAGRWRPLPPVLDLALDGVRPRAPDSVVAPVPADGVARAAGREITAVMRDAQVVTLSGIRVVDPHGIVVASTGGDLDRSLADWEEVHRALRGEPVSLLRRRVEAYRAPLGSISRGADLRIFVALPVLAGDRVWGAVILSRTPRTIGQALYGKRRELLYAGLMLVGAVLLLSLVTSLTISRPVQALVRQADRTARGETGALTPLARPVTVEVAHLSEALARMAATLEQRAAYIRTFASHVSHEFKTPLTAIRGTVELLHTHLDSMSQAERARFLANLDADAERLQRLVQRLLELARADMAPAGAGSVRTAVRPVLDGVAARYRQHAQLVTVAATPGGDADPCVAMAAETLDSILSNLIDNARHHGGPGVAVSLSYGGAPTDPKGTGGTVVLTIGDTGPGISAGNADRIFDPFFTTGRKEGRTGLGLPIVRALVAAHGGRIDLMPQAAGDGACFRIQLPVV